MSDDEILNDDEDVTIEAEFSINVCNSDHNELTNRNIADQHTISAITGLQDALDGKASEEDLTDHIEDTDNPHEVTKAQVGLGNVANVDTTNASNITSGTLSNDRLGTIPYSKLSGVASSAQGTKADTALQQSDVINNVTSTTTNAPLSANMGKELQDQITNLKQRGRYLSIWNCSTGLAETTPTVNPYSYKAGDYFIVGIIATGSASNYKPVGSTYDKDVPSTTIETGTVKVNDTYYYDGSSWTLLSTEQPTVAFSTLAGSPYDNANLTSALNAKVTGNTSITGATKCKITYDSKGLVTSGSDLSASDIPDISSTYYLASNPSGYISQAVDDSSTTSTTLGWSASKLNTTIGNIESSLLALRGNV